MSVVLLLNAACALSQDKTGVKQESKNSPCSNIVALAGNTTVNCSSLTPGQAKIIASIPKVLDKIISNQLDTDLVMQKLDEIQKAINPNLPSTAYSCAGATQTAGPNELYTFAITTTGINPAAQPMYEMYRLNQFTELIAKCTQALQTNPGWLTPYLFCGIGYAGIGNKQKASEMLAIFESRKGPAYQRQPCIELLNVLKVRLQ